MNDTLPHPSSMPQGWPEALSSSATLRGPDNEAQARRGWLKNGNPPGDLSKAPQCGAKTRRGTPCRAPAMANGRCRMHGGCSTGPRTPEGLERSRRANWKHGYYAASAKAQRKARRAQWRWYRQCIGMLRWVEKLWALLFEIADQLDRGQSKGLERRCQRALRMWDKFEAILTGCQSAGEKCPEPSRKPNPSPSVLRTLLEMGARGTGAEEIRRRLLEAATP